MTYTPQIPLTGESLGSTRARINTNFQEIFNDFGVNHNDLSSSGAGKHKFMQMPEQSSAPLTTVNEIGLYTKQDPNAGSYTAETSLFLREESNGFEYQITKGVLAQTGKFATNGIYQVGPPQLSGGWTFLPGGLILQYGQNDVAASASTYTFNFPFIFPTSVFNIQITPFRAASSPGSDNEFWVVSGFTTTSFQIYNKGSHSFSFMWTAIGK